MPGASLAVVSVSEGGPSWERVRRALDERSETLTYLGPTSVSLPWWEFLACRKALAFYIGREGLRLDVDGPTRAQLELAATRQSTYDLAAGASPMAEDEVLRRLDSSGFARRLTAEQVRNVSRMARMDAAAGFSVPGSGKTTEALAYYALHGGFDNLLLVIAPRNAFAAWEEQLTECFASPPASFVRLEGGESRIRTILGNGPPTLSLISYRQVITESVREQLSDLLAGNPVLVVLDESHRIKKGATGDTGRAVLSFSHLPKARLILSGTPAPNSIDDLVPQFNFLFPELGATSANVAHRFQPVYTRTTKAELGLKPAVVTPIQVPLPQAHRRLYEALRSDEARRLLGLRAKERMMLRSAGRSALRLLQAASNPQLLSHVSEIPGELISDAIQEQVPGKLEYVCRRAREVASHGQKVVIWSSFVENVEVIAARLADLGADFVHGGVFTGDELDEDTRESKIKAFHDDPGKKVLVANPAACSEGISLHRVCHHAIFLDRTFNAAHYLQAKDRIHRLGLDPSISTRVELVIAPESIDEIVEHRLRIKIDRLATVLNDPGLREEEDVGDPDDPKDLNLTFEDLKDLLIHLRIK